MSSRYELVVYWSDEDRAFIVDVPELPGCMAHGDTREEAIAEAEQAIQLWIATCREIGRQVPQPKGRRLTPAEHAVLARCGAAVSELDPDLLAQAFESYQQEKLSLGQAARLVGLGRFDFQQLLAQHGIPLTLDVDDLEQDLETLRRLDRLHG